MTFSLPPLTTWISFQWRWGCGDVKYVRRCGTALRPMDLNELTALLHTLGCPLERSSEMAIHLDRRARQLAAQKGRTYDEAMAHLLGLMRQGWAAKDQGH